MLISESLSPRSFWNVVLGYCYHNNHSVEQIKHFYRFFLNNYLKYPYDQWYTLELNIFGRTCKHLLDNIYKSDRMSIEQIILETLALRPNSTVKELTQYIKKFGEDEIRDALSTFTPIRYEPGEIRADVDGKYYLNGTVDMREKWQLALNKIIKVNHNAQAVDRYQLSLFGILFVLMLVRYNDMKKLKHGLYHHNQSFLEYYDIIADKYKDAIPLIFKKWGLLKSILKSVAAYNFDIILDRQFREQTIGELAVFKQGPEDELHITCGNKYFFKSSKSILEITRHQMGEMQLRGMEALYNFVRRRVRDFPVESIENARSLVERKIDAVSRLILEITVNLETIGYDPITFKEKALEWGIHPQEAETLAQCYEIDSIERPIANEIAFLYYMNLNDEWYFHVMDPNKMEPPAILERPAQCLLAIHEQDRDIREWFSVWVNYLVKYQEGVLQTMNKFYNKIRI